MDKNIQQIPTFKNFLKGLEQIQQQQLQIKKNGIHSENNEYSKQSTGVVIPKGKHYLISQDGNISFTGEKFSLMDNKEKFPPFSTAENLLNSKNDFEIDFAEAIKFYELNKKLAIAENEKILSSDDFKPEHPVKYYVEKEMKDVQGLLKDSGKDPANEKVAKLLDDHFNKVEKLITTFTDQIQNQSKKDLPDLEKRFTEKLKGIFTEFKNSLRKLVLDTKEQTRSNIKNKVNDMKINTHNAIATRVQGVNDKVKDFTNKIDQKYQVIERKSSNITNENTKEHKSDQQEKTNGNDSLKSEVAALRTFVKTLKKTQPEAYQAVINHMQGAKVDKKEQKTEIANNNSKVKEKKQEIQL
ncbi:hypothetical protein [Paraliobacillus ryukyuensis]|uniref:hypothetical protein n=1 Tax=Paraliobacillus ryukyuensis TaxID=200904 RepID=UPI0009A8F3D0|nr:hypothetical protein [Paraliobacillus ryukyuensis]